MLCVVFLGSTNKTTKGMTIIISHNLLWECTGQRVNGKPNGYRQTGFFIKSACGYATQ